MRAPGALYNPYPSHKTAFGAAVAAVAAVGGAVGVHERFVVRGMSMAPTLLPGDRLLVRRWPRRLAPGALVVVAAPLVPRRLVVKRISSVRGAQVTVLGDNPAASTDSRSYGPLPRAALRGRVVYRYAPRERAGPL